MRTLIAAIGTSFVLFLGSNGVPEKHRAIEKHYPTQASQRIEIDGFTGSDIRFISWDKNEVYVKIDITISSSDEEYERRYIESASIMDSQTSEALKVKFEEPERLSREGKSFWGVLRSIFSGSYVRKEISGEIYVPRSNALSTDMRYGSITLEDMKGALRLLGTANTLKLKNCSSVQEIENDYGNTTLEQCGGNLDLSTKSSKVSIEQFDGKVSVDADYSTITVRDVRQPVSISSTSATITVENVRGDATIHSDYSTITANSIAGMLEVRTKSGKIKARGVDGLSVDADYTEVEASNVTGKASKEIVVSGRSGSLRLEDAVGNLRVTDPYSNVELRNLRGNVDLSSTSSRVTAEEVVGDWHSSTEYSSVTVQGLTAQRVWMVNKSNPIDLQLKTAPSNIEIKNEYGSVTVSMPTGFSGDVDLNASYGNIETNFPLDRKKSFGGAGGYAIGKVGSGTGKISIETTSGNIRLTQR